MKKLIVLLVVALLLFFIISAPDSAGSVTHTIGNGLGSGATAIVTFVQTLFR